ncbi:MAG TPA: UDP-forming cellulose synthase catalytic subunit [Gallionellaceae bacterium]
MFSGNLIIARFKEPGWQVVLAAGLVLAFLFYALQFTYAYFDTSRQMYLGWGCFIFIALTFRSRKAQQQPYRLLLMVVASFLALRYMQWRSFDSLLYTGPFDFIGMALLYLAELYGFAIYMLGMFINVWPLESRHIPLPEDRDKLPTVDVFIPTYNEPLDIVRITATAAAQIDYPKEKLNIYILDDGGTQAKRNHSETGMEAWGRHYSLRETAAELGISYITRETNQQAKAGNINHALRYTAGEVILVLDCDHVPTRDILQNTVGQFIADPKLFLVQTPHFFINPTPVEKNLEGKATPSSESDMFYRRIHPGLNFWNASYFCGSAALLRRTCLMEVGGIRGTTITEDAETAYQLHARGYNSVYVNRPMVCGLSPESYDDYVTQRSRWAQGMVQLVLLNNPLKTRGLSLPQRIAYFNSSFFWMFGFPRFIYFIAPAAYLILGLNVYHASWMQILAFTLPYVLSIYMVMHFFYAGTRQPFFSEIYESVQSLFLMPAVISVLLNPWKPTFKVTPKGLTHEKSYLSPLAAPFFLVIGINVVAVVLAGLKWVYEPLLRDVIAVTVIWCFYNLYLSVVSLGAFWERKQTRKFYRIAAEGKITVRFPRMGDAVYAGEVHDVSLSGIGFAIQLPFMPRERDEVVFEVQDSYGRTYHFESRVRQVIIRGGKYLCGSEYIHERVSYADVVSYVFGDSRRWQQNWERKSETHGTGRMIRRFIGIGLFGFVAGIIPLTIHALVWLWKQSVRLVTTHVLRDRVLDATSWFIYFFYLALVSLVELLDRTRVRKLQRVHVSGSATVYFPRLDATLQGEISDVSLTGMGIIVELPFAIHERERVTIRTMGRDGEVYQFASLIERTSKNGEKFLCGAEFIVDTYAYPKIVRFVYGNSLDMLYKLAVQEGGIAKQGRMAAKGILSRLSRSIAVVLSFIFLKHETKRTQEPTREK